MKQVSITSIVEAVEICIDEIAANDAEFEGTQDDTERSTIIQSKIEDALRFVYMNADQWLLEPTDTVDSMTVASAGGITVGTVSIPTGYLRLLYVKCGSWSKALGQEDIIDWTDPEYAMLKDKYATGTPERPKAAMTANASGRVLELYQPQDSGDTVLLGYMKQPAISDGTVNINIPDKIYRAVIYYIAALTLETYGEVSRANGLMGEVATILGLGHSQTAPAQVAAQQQAINNE